MTIPSLSDLVVSVDNEFPLESSGIALTAEQVQKLKRISQAGSDTVGVLTAGLAAVGELMAISGEDEMTHQSLIGIGWLVHELADLTCRLHDECIAANHKLQHMKVEVSQ